MIGFYSKIVTDLIKIIEDIGEIKDVRRQGSMVLAVCATIIVVSGYNFEEAAEILLEHARNDERVNLIKEYLDGLEE